MKARTVLSALINALALVKMQSASAFAESASGDSLLNPYVDDCLTPTLSIEQAKSLRYPLTAVGKWFIAASQEDPAKFIGNSDFIVTWCQKETPGYKRFELVYRGLDQAKLEGCNNTVAIAHSVMGLAVSQAENASMDEMIEVETKNLVPKFTFTGPVIVGFEEGVVQLYACHDGKWLTKGID